MAAGVIEDVGINVVASTKDAKRGFGRFLGWFGDVDKAQRKANASASMFARTSGKIGQTAGGVASLGKSVAGVAGGMLAFSGISGIFGMLSGQMPIIGQAFQNLGRVITANIIWPMVKELLPLIHRLTAWVRENRTNFVKLGTVIMNVFRAAKTIISAVFSAGSKFAGAFFDKVGGGTLTFQKFIDFLNFLLLKVVFLFTFIAITLEPVLESIGALLGNLFTNAVVPFYEGFWEQMSGLGEVFQQFSGLLAMIGNDLAGVFGGSMPFMKTFGQILGGTIIGALRIIMDLLSALYTGVVRPFFSALAEGFGDAFAGSSGFGDSLGDLGGIIKQVFGFLALVLRQSAPLFKFLGKLIGVVLGGALRIVAALLTGIVGIFQYLTTDLPDLFGSAIDTIVGRFMGLKNAILGVVSTVIGKVKDIARTVWNSIVSTFANIGTAIKDSISNALSAVGDELKNSKLGVFLTGLVGGDDSPANNEFANPRAVGGDPINDSGGPALAPSPAVSRGGNSQTNNDNRTQTVTIEDRRDPEATAAAVSRRLNQPVDWRRDYNRSRQASE